MLRVISALSRREVIRFLRQPQRVIGSVAQPILFWAFLGTGFTPSFRLPGMEGISYLEYFYPGVLLMMMLFASIFSTITIIEDRDQGFLQGVLTAPVSRMGIVLGKVIGGMILALGQSAILLVAVPFLGLKLTLGGALLLAFGAVATAAGFTSLGFLIAWNMRSTAGYHAIMMVFLMPMWLLSGALFPIEGAPFWLKLLMEINPASQALVLIRMPFYGGADLLLSSENYLKAASIVLAWGGICLFLSLARVNRPEKGASA